MLNIPDSIIRTAYAGTSFDPEGRGRRTVQGYQSELQADLDRMREHATKGGTLDLYQEQADRYTAGYRRRVLALMHSESRCVSSFIAGPSNFPFRRMEKRNNIVHKRMEDMSEFRRRALKSAIRELRPDLRPIMSGDADAIDRLESEHAQLSRLQERMKAVNLAHGRFVKNPATLDAADHISEQDKARIRAYKPEYSWEPHPFAPYQLQNNGANIRRIEARIEQLTAAKAAPMVEREGATGVRLEDDPPANRVRLFFPGKPDQATRDRLKKQGFRWSPTIGAWQAYRNTWSLALASEFTQ